LLSKIPQVLGSSFRRCVPWVELAKASGAAVLAAGGVVAIRAVAHPAYAGLPPGFLWRALPLAAAGVLFAIGYFAALRIAGVRPLAVLASFRPHRAAR
jgi:hypothetical protein